MAYTASSFEELKLKKAEDDLLRKYPVIRDRFEQCEQKPRKIVDLSGLNFSDEDDCTKLLDVVVNKYPELTKLDLSSNELKSIPDTIGGLQNLTSLNLSNNQLANVTESIENLQNLTSLNLSNNQLTNVPESIWNLQNLTSLNLSSNQLANVPKSIENLQNLTDLRLYDNQLTNVPESIEKLQNLEALNLSINQLTNVPESIGSLQNLRKLSLSSNQLTNVPESIGSLQNLTELSLSRNQLTNVPESIGNLENLTNLSLSHNPFTEATYQFLDAMESTTLTNCVIVYDRAAHDSRTTVENTLGVLYPNTPKRVVEILEKINQLPLQWTCSVGQGDKTARKTLEDFLSNGSVFDQNPNTPINMAARNSLERILDGTNFGETQQTELQKLATALGNCGTPVKAFLTSLFIEPIIHKLQNNETIENKDLLYLQREAVQEEFVKNLAKIGIANTNEFVEMVQGFLNKIYAPKGLPSKTNYPEFASDLASGNLEAVACFLELVGVENTSFESFKADDAKLDLILGKHFAKEGIYLDNRFKVLNATRKAVTKLLDDARKNHQGSFDFSDENDLNLLDDKKQVANLESELQKCFISNCSEEVFKITAENFLSDVKSKIGERVGINALGVIPNKEENSLETQETQKTPPTKKRKI